MSTAGEGSAPLADADPAVQLFAAHRGAVVGAAYRVLGSLADAEDVAQETWLRWATVRPGGVAPPPPHPVRIGTRLALNRVRQLSRRREEYVGPWLPEPVGDLGRVGADATTELADSVSYAMLVLLAALTPPERAAFVLHEVFGVPYAEVATTLDRSEAAVRQLVHRARTHLRERSPRHPVDRRTHAAVTDQFLQATRDGSIGSLVELLAPDVVLVSDGGGQRQAALRPLVGRDKVLRFAVGVLAKPETAGLEVAPCTVNGEAAIGLYARLPDGSLVVDSITVLVLDGGLVTTVLLVRNPDKLAGLHPGVTPA
jgi:RNA polymerase sigma-70 factor (ECF subfamily)